MADLPDLNVKITADTASLDAALKKAQNSAKGFEDSFKGASSAADDLGKASQSAEGRISSFSTTASKASVGIAAIGTAAIAAGAALVSITKSASEAAKEISILANQAGVSAQEFQALAFAANKVGIEQDKLGDIFKDSRDKVGDFLATGGGELKDFFETVAPLAGVTAEEFKNLSGPQVLEKFQKALDDANVAANEQVFFLESLADEASRLQPLLTNNAAALNQYTSQAEQFNLTLSDLDVAQLRQAESAFDDISTVIRVRAQQAVADLSPLIVAVSQQFMESSGSGREFGEVAFNAVRTVAQGVAAVIDGVTLLHAGFQGLVVVTAAVGSAVASSIAAMANGIDEFINNIKDDLNEFVDFANNTGFFDIERFKTEGSEFAKVANDIAFAMKASLEENQADLGNILAGPTALQRVTSFFDGVVAKSEEARAALAEGGAAGGGMALGGFANLAPSAEGDKDTSEEDAIKLLEEQMAERRRIMEEFDVFEAERAIEKFEADKERIEAAALFDAQIAENKHLLLQELEEEHIAKMNEIYNKDAKNKEKAEKFMAAVSKQMRSEAFQTAVGFLSALGSKSETAAKAALALEKAQGIASTIISTQSAAQKALAELGPIAGPAVAAGIVALGAARVAQIASTDLSSSVTAVGAGATTATTASTTGTTTSSTASSSASPTAQSESSIVNINLEGEVFGREQVRSLISSINEALDDGARLRVR